LITHVDSPVANKYFLTRLANDTHHGFNGLKSFQTINMSKEATI